MIDSLSFVIQLMVITIGMKSLYLGFVLSLSYYYFRIILNSHYFIRQRGSSPVRWLLNGRWFDAGEEDIFVFSNTIQI